MKLWNHLRVGWDMWHAHEHESMSTCCAVLCCAKKQYTETYASGHGLV